MEFKSHGGACCGMSHIFNLGSSPEYLLPALPAAPVHQPLGTRYPLARPEETAKERMAAFLDYYDAHEYVSLITEVTVIGYHRTVGSLESQNARWQETLLGLGFKVVNRFLNSNSGNVVIVYHRGIGGRRNGPLPTRKNPPATAAVSHQSIE